MADQNNMEDLWRQYSEIPAGDDQVAQRRQFVTALGAEREAQFQTFVLQRLLDTDNAGQGPAAEVQQAGRENGGENAPLDPAANVAPVVQQPPGAENPGPVGPGGRLDPEGLPRLPVRARPAAMSERTYSNLLQSKVVIYDITNNKDYDMVVERFHAYCPLGQIDTHQEARTIFFNFWLDAEAQAMVRQAGHDPYDAVGVTIQDYLNRVKQGLGLQVNLADLYTQFREYKQKGDQGIEPYMREKIRRFHRCYGTILD